MSKVLQHVCLTLDPQVGAKLEARPSHPMDMPSAALLACQPLVALASWQPVQQPTSSAAHSSSTAERARAKLTVLVSHPAGEMVQVYTPHTGRPPGLLLCVRCGDEYAHTRVVGREEVLVEGAEATSVQVRVILVAALVRSAAIVHIDLLTSPCPLFPMLCLACGISHGISTHPPHRPHTHIPLINTLISIILSLPLHSAGGGRPCCPLPTTFDRAVVTRGGTAGCETLPGAPAACLSLGRNRHKPAQLPGPMGGRSCCRRNSGVESGAQRCILCTFCG